MNELDELYTAFSTSKDAEAAPHCQLLQQARQCVARVDRSAEAWQTLRNLVGGILPETPKGSLQTLTINKIQYLQALFLERLTDWTRYMATTGSARQGRWKQRGWLHLIFNALKTYTARGDDVPPRHTTLENWYTDHVGPRWRREGEEARKNSRALIRNTSHVTQEIKHGITCCLMHIRWIQKPKAALTQNKANRKENIKIGRQRIARYILRTHQQTKAQNEIHNRLIQRQGKISAHTRTVKNLHRINYAETKFRQKPCIQRDEYYKTLRKWPQQDKLGPVLAQQHPRTATFL